VAAVWRRSIAAAETKVWGFVRRVRDRTQRVVDLNMVVKVEVVFDALDSRLQWNSLVNQEETCLKMQCEDHSLATSGQLVIPEQPGTL